MVITLWKRTLIVATLAISLVACALLIWRLADVLLLGFTGVLFAVFLRACADPLHRATRLPEGWALVCVVLMFLSLAILSSWLLLPRLIAQANGFLTNLPTLVAQLEHTLAEVPLLDDLGRGLASLEGLAGRLSDRAFATLSSTIGALANVLLVVITGIFLAADPKLYRHDLLRLVPVRLRGRARSLLDRLGQTLRAWLLGQLLAMTFVALLVFLGTWLVGLPYALALGIAAGLLDFVPFIGPFLAAAPALLLAVTGGSTSQLVWVVVIYVVVQQLEGSLFQPLIQEWAVSIPPALLLLSLVAFGTLFGFIGLVIATPVTAVALTLIKELYVKRLEKGLEGDATSNTSETP